nr:MAG TPA: hypothetical protein [Caudoviricetes sp.]
MLIYLRKNLTLLNEKFFLKKFVIYKIYRTFASSNNNCYSSIKCILC